MFYQTHAFFGFVLKKGIACLILPAQDADDVLEKIDYLQTQHKLLAQNVFVWADRRAAASSLVAFAWIAITADVLSVTGNDLRLQHGEFK